MAARDKQKQAEGDEPSRDESGEPGDQNPSRVEELQATLDRAAQGLGGGDSTLGRIGDASEKDASERDATTPTTRGSADETDDEEQAAGTLGAARYVMAGFFLTCIAAAYVLGRLLSSLWGRLAETVWFMRSLTTLARVGEEERSEICMVLGAIVALGLGIYTYRRSDVHEWTDEVASELAKVTWPDKNEVTNSTIIVIVTSTFATVYLALLDRFWGFVTNLVYGS